MTTRCFSISCKGSQEHIIKISLVVVMDEAGAIGYQQQLLCHLPADLRRFKQLTLGKPVVMGRKTFESIGRPLPNRLNIVLSRQPLCVEGVVVEISLEAALRTLKTTPEVMIIGGAQVYEQALPLASCIYLTTIHHCFQADCFFPLLSWHDWSVVTTEEVPADEKNPYAMTFSTWVRAT